MLCQNCGENEANVKYTQIINGVKKEISLCSDCAKKLGINNMVNEMELPIDFNSFLGEFFNDYAESDFLPTINNEEIKCKKCGLKYEDFIKNGEFGCEECYNTFSNAIDSVLKRLQGSSEHIGRKPTKLISNKDNDVKVEEKEEKPKEDSSKETKKKKLQNELDKAIKEERYEDAAKIRDELKEVE